MYSFLINKMTARLVQLKAKIFTISARDSASSDIDSFVQPEENIHAIKTLILQRHSVRFFFKFDVPYYPMANNSLL